MVVEGVVNELTDVLSLNDGNIDYITQIESTNTIGRIFSVVLGMGLVLVMFLIPIFIALEICYIAFPLFRTNYEKLKENSPEKGKRIAVVSFVLRDAIKAVEKNETDPNVMGKETLMMTYLKIKIISLPVAMLIIALIINGTTNIVAIAITTITEPLLNVLP